MASSVGNNMTAEQDCQASHSRALRLRTARSMCQGLACPKHEGIRMPAGPARTCGVSLVANVFGQCTCSVLAAQPSCCRQYGSTAGQAHLHLRGVGIAAELDGQRKLGGKHRERAQLAGEDIVKQGPKLGQLVLDGAACHNDPVHSLQLLGHQRDLQTQPSS